MRRDDDLVQVLSCFVANTVSVDACLQKNSFSNTDRFIKPYRNPVYKCTGSRQGSMKWALSLLGSEMRNQKRHAAVQSIDFYIVNYS